MLEKSHTQLRCQAHYQIEAMCGAMLKAAQTGSFETMCYLVQSLTIRIDALNRVMMDAEDDINTATVKALRDEVRGPYSYIGGSHV